MNNQFRTWLRDMEILTMFLLSDIEKTDVDPSIVGQHVQPLKKKFKPCRHEGTKIIGQSKAFYRQRIPESSCARKETVETDILVTPRNGDRKIMQSIRITSRLPSRKRKWNQLSQF